MTHPDKVGLSYGYGYLDALRDIFQQTEGREESEQDKAYNEGYDDGQNDRKQFLREGRLRKEKTKFVDYMFELTYGDGDES